MDVVAQSLSKTYGRTVAVDDVSFTVTAGRVTGFLGPNGAGKSTVMRLMLGLDRGQGQTLFDGTPFSEHRDPAKVAGAHLDAKAFHSSRSAEDHLRMVGAAAGVPRKRVGEVLDLMGLREVAGKTPKKFSLGMAQRLGLGAAIIAEPAVLVLDEPANGLDPQSIYWLREFLKFYAASGNSVFVSSHLLSEMQLLADDVIVIAAGQLKAATTLDEFVAANSARRVRARASDLQALETALSSQGLAVSRDEDHLLIDDVTTDDVGRLAHTSQIELLELTLVESSLEEAFLSLTSGDQQYATGGQG